MTHHDRAVDLLDRCAHDRGIVVQIAPRPATLCRAGKVDGSHLPARRFQPGRNQLPRPRPVPRPMYQQKGRFGVLARASQLSIVFHTESA
jgi:hypothetical protein